METFVSFGAPNQILYLTKPHIGTDNLVKIIRNMRNFIIENGGKFLFNTKFIDFDVENGKLSKIHVKNLITDEFDTLIADCLILAIGHSSRDTFEKSLSKRTFNGAKKFFCWG